MLKLVLNRDVLKPTYTLGKLSVYRGAELLAYFFTVEDTVRESGVKVKAETAIPAGTYKVIVNMSNRFKKLMPLLIDVPMFEGIRIHSGNKAADSEGCIIVGMGRTTTGVATSRNAFNKLMELLAENGNEAEFQIMNSPQDLV